MSKSFRGRLLAAIFSVGVAGALVSAPASAETLADAIALAYDSNPTLQAQRATQRALDESFVQARSGWRPTLSVTAAGVYAETDATRASRLRASGGFPVTGDGLSYRNQGQATLSFSQPLWTGGRTAAAV